MERIEGEGCKKFTTIILWKVTMSQGKHGNFRFIITVTVII